MRVLLIAIVTALFLIACARHHPVADKKLIRDKLYEGCKANTDAPVAKLLDASQFDAICSCAADKGAERISPEQMRGLEKSGAGLGSLKAILKEAGRSCAEPLVTQDFKPIIKRACLLNAKGQPGVSTQQVNDYCACTASKTAEGMDTEGRRNMLMAEKESDAPAESAKLEAAMRFCVQAL